ncbi:TonB-linked SusC/RagA family outer membrane protein [Pedobacter sp. CAN_A7]|uniref:SusC/RagA family TonB-linked outer membrane protein n=1 Tax=Pedobacter sp. CAN_A7 TaxID=2787722 RepID=UPI0018C90873
MAAKLLCIYRNLRGRHLLSLLSLLLVSYVSQGQTVTGKVSDQNGEPLVGVSVSIRSANLVTSTNGSGQYVIQAAPDATLSFNMIGFKQQEVAVNKRTVINVVLTEDSQNLSEVVVTALGIKKDSRKLGYSAETVKLQEIQQNRTTNVMTSLEGKIAGLEIAPPSSGAGGSNRIRLRGQAAFSGANNSPLIVINGLPMDQGARGADGNNALDLGDNLQQINPDDVETMTVLKGATAAALYGSRAANGAIIITTKTGKKNSKFGVEVTSNFSTDEVLDFTDFQYEYGQGQAGVRPATQGAAISTGQFGWGEKYDGVPTVQFDGISRPYSPQKNRITNFYRTGTSAINSVALSGGNATGSFRTSFSNQDVKGISPNNDYHKKIFNLGVNQNVTEKLSVQVNINYTNEQNENPPQVGVQGSGAPNFLYRMANSISLDVLKEKALADNGITERQTSGFQTTLINPYFLMPRQFIRSNRDRFLGTTTVRYDFFKWLYLQGRVNMDYATPFLEQNTPTGMGSSTPFNGTGAGYNGNYSVNSSTEKQMNMDFLLGVNREFGNFSFDASIGGNRFTITNKNVTQSVTDFTAINLYSIENGITKDQNFGIYREQVNSLYAFADIGYKNLLYLNVTARQDWFSVLDPANNSYLYPSVSGSFIFSELLKGSSWLNFGKLRATYADVGSANGITAFSNRLAYGVEANPYNGISLGTIRNVNSPNPLIKPFGVTEKEIGLELKTFGSRVNFDIAFYDKKTSDQIIIVPVSNASGYTGTPLNLGSLQNRGIELLVDLLPVVTPNFRWNTSFNTAFNDSEVLSLAPGVNRQIVSQFGGNEFIGSLVYEVGKPLNQLAARTYLRNDNGDIVVGANGRLLANNTDVLFGSGTPNYTGGWNNSFHYKKLSLLVHIDFKFGGKILSSTQLNGLRQGHTKSSLVGREGGVIFPGVLQDGSPNTVAVDPQTFYTDYRTLQIADPFIYKADFVKLRNITLAYDFSDMIGTKWKFVKGLTLSASCRNVLFIKKYIDDLDPEAFASSGDNRIGYEQTTLPTTRNYGLNLNVKF